MGGGARAAFGVGVPGFTPPSPAPPRGWRVAAVGRAWCRGLELGCLPDYPVVTATAAGSRSALGLPRRRPLSQATCAGSPPAREPPPGGGRVRRERPGRGGAAVRREVGTRSKGPAECVAPTHKSRQDPLLSQRHGHGPAATPQVVAGMASPRGHWAQCSCQSVGEICDLPKGRKRR